MKKQIERCLNTTWVGKNIIYEECIDSTNAYAKLLGKKNGINGTVVIADRQTAGRGRRGRNWISPDGNCYFSLLLRPIIRMEHTSRLTLVAALATANAVRGVTELDTQIKWPNDVVVNGKKICGILTESSMGVGGVEYVVIGIGINANQRVFDSEIEAMATSIWKEKGMEYNRAELISGFLNKFEGYYEAFVQTEDLSMLMKEYNSILVNRGKEVRILDENERICTALGINEAGELLVCDKEDNVDAILAGEVSVRGLYGYV